MDNFAKRSNEERKEIFKEAASKCGMFPTVIEKDFWVCWTLGKLFRSELLNKKILFKGGTSLSKVFKLIKRFSEDIDLVLDWNQVIHDEPMNERSKTAQDRLNKQIVLFTQQYIKEVFFPEVQKQIQEVCTATIKDASPDIIDIQYPTSFEEKYLRPEIRLEIGALASWLPNAEYAITSYVAEEFPKLFTDSIVSVKAVKAERTFWEKATILHREAHRQEGNSFPERYSRHYYDLMVMAQSPVKLQAFDNLSLLQDVVKFKQKFYPCGWACYELAKPGTFRLLPSESNWRNLQTDYKQMKIMIFKDEPEFSQIMASIELLEKEINEL